jgi:hypothetical protein
MKKYSNILLSTALGAIVLLFAACDAEDKIFDEVQANVQRGAVLRTIEVFNDEFIIGTTDGVFSLEVEVQDQEDGDLLESVDVYHSFLDGSPENGPGDVAETLVGSIPPSAFSPGEFGWPRTVYSADFNELVSNTGLTASDINGSDQFRIRFALNLSDGRSYTNTDNSGTLTGSFYRSPFLYSATVVCPPITPEPGTWTIAQQDSFGDSWNGASISVTLDGVTTDYAHAGGGNETIFTFEVPVGAVEINMVYNAGTFDSENSFQVISANGLTVYEATAPPTANVVFFDYCDLTLDL